ncbi:hypothetical protein [Dolichospermum sp. UHCC 0259]|uniref:hypothetical protein n=1 Tax=Dolichospermum sp. UHCC 0259 TaxID=2590010 RepID=UPI0014478ABA|nr:hypothetical protein [Dolichospermum sp. UHCC 0259]
MGCDRCLGCGSAIAKRSVGIAFGMLGMRSLLEDVRMCDSEALLQAVRCWGFGRCDRF